jgi:rubrerythrin
MKDAESLYRKFIQFEEQAASIYLGMASHFCPQNPELSALWLDMGMQEKQHAGLLQFCVVEHLFAESAPTPDQIRRVEEMFRDLTKRAASPTLSIHEAFQVAAELESSEVNEAYSHLTTPLHDSMYMLKRKIAASMPDHLERLLQEARKYRVPETALSGLIRVARKTSA